MEDYGPRRGDLEKRQFSPVSVLKLLSHGKVDLKVKFHVSGQGTMNHISLLHSLSFSP
jgi:hypothetical protein